MRPMVSVLACVLAVACGSSSIPEPAASTPPPRVVQPEIMFVQLVGPADQNFPTGSMQVQYGMRISNRWSQPITLRSIELLSMGQGGPYILKRDTYFFGKKIEPSAYRDVIWWATAVARGNAFALDAEAPVSVRAIAFFESPQGTFRKVLFRDFSQFGSGARRGN